MNDSDNHLRGDGESLEANGMFCVGVNEAELDVMNGSNEYDTGQESSKQVSRQHGNTSSAESEL